MDKGEEKRAADFRDRQRVESSGADNPKKAIPRAYTQKEILVKLREIHELGKVEQRQEDRIKRNYRLGGAAIVGAATVGATYPLIHELGKTVRMVYEQGRNIHSMKNAVHNLVTKRGVGEIKKFMEDNRDLSARMGKEIEAYRLNLENRQNAIRDIRYGYEQLGNLSRMAPGFDTEAAKYLTKIRMQLNSTLASVVTGRDQSIRSDENYAQNYNRVLGLITDAIDKKQLTSEKIGKIIKELGTITDKEQKQFVSEKKALEGLMRQYNQYQSLVNSPEKLSDTEIRDMGETYGRVVETARGYGLNETSQTGKYVGAGSELLAAAIVASFSGKYVGKPVGNAAYALRNLVRKAFPGKKPQEVDQKLNEIARDIAESGREGELEKEVAPRESKLTNILLVLFGCLAFLTGIGTITGNIISNASNTAPINVAFLTSLGLFVGILSRKIYKRRKK